MIAGNETKSNEKRRLKLETGLSTRISVDLRNRLVKASDVSGMKIRAIITAALKDYLPTMGKAKAR